MDNPVIRRARSAAAMLLFPVIALAACGDGPAGPAAGDPFFQATVLGGLSATFEGEGFFVSRPPWHAPRPGGMFLLMSADLSGDERYGFDFGMFGVNRPEEGEYALELPDRPVPPGTRPRWLWSRFTVRGESSYEVYHARSGVIEITESAEDRVAGTFVFEGVRTGRCVREDRGVSCEFRPPRAEEGDEVTIDVTGSFDAVPLPHRRQPPRPW